MERNFVLVNSNVIGGPREKVIPTRNFNENVKKNKFKQCLESFNSFPWSKLVIFNISPLIFEGNRKLKFRSFVKRL